MILVSVLKCMYSCIGHVMCMSASYDDNYEYVMAHCCTNCPSYGYDSAVLR